MNGEITITDRAAEKIRALLGGAKEGHGLRVKVVDDGKGCVRKATLGREATRAV
jgi:Fe-S cluster assembly iron-binding protein IscA